MKKFVVTGGSGFIGSNLVKFLLRKNYFVINIDKLSYSANPYNLKRIFKNKNYKFFKQDINNRNKILKLLNRFKPVGIFNLAEFSSKSIKSNLHIEGNFIQKKVWRELKNIKFGKTKTYGEIAKKYKLSPRHVGKICSQNKLLLITAIQMVDDYFDLFQKVKNTKNDFEKLSIKFKELRSLAIKYKGEKEMEIGKLNDEINAFKTTIEKSRNSYEETLDKTTKSISKFIEQVEINQEKNIQ